MKKYWYLLSCILFFYACDSGSDPDNSDNSNLPNILLIIADDMGKDATSGFTEGTIKPNTPHLDQLKNDGLTFTNFWANPTCSPTRASIITGKYGYRTGVKWAGDELDSSEEILHQYITSNTNDAYATALVGKWHLSGETTTINPESFGMDYYAGLARGATQDYYMWQLSEDGTTSLQNDYITESFTDLSINWVNQQSKPWFLWLAYNAPHTPFHVPPADMHFQGDLPEYTDDLDPMPYYMAAIEAMDFQIGRLLDAIPADQLENTLILFMGDNGTPNQVAQFPFDSNKAKGTLYQGGINVPLFVSGAGVERKGEDSNLIISTDLFSTIAEVAGVEENSTNDSQSFQSLFSNSGSNRPYQYSEMNSETRDQWSISNGLYKLIVNANGNQEMYNVSSDPYENVDLLLGQLTTEEESSKLELEKELDNIRD
ncbi:MAG: sulfatase-like hydrolase/transferase [Saprospiraceae bacterium]|nr:sulfatase-like hydrolase/transferase [Saprospiraceae bacterium]